MKGSKGETVGMSQVCCVAKARAATIPALQTTATVHFAQNVDAYGYTLAFQRESCLSGIDNFIARTRYESNGEVRPDDRREREPCAQDDEPSQGHLEKHGEQHFLTLSKLFSIKLS